MTGQIPWVFQHSKPTPSQFTHLHNEPAWPAPALPHFWPAPQPYPAPSQQPLPPPRESTHFIPPSDLVPATQKQALPPRPVFAPSVPAPIQPETHAQQPLPARPAFAPSTSAPIQSQAPVQHPMTQDELIAAANHEFQNTVGELRRIHRIPDDDFAAMRSGMPDSLGTPDDRFRFLQFKNAALAAQNVRDRAIHDVLAFGFDIHHAGLPGFAEGEGDGEGGDVDFGEWLDM